VQTDDGPGNIADNSFALADLGVNLATEEDRRMHELLQNDGAMLDWIAVPNS